MSELLFPAHQFGAADAFGFVGESPAIWEVRERLMTITGSPAHVLLLGASGTGKEIAAQALHQSSSRRGRPLVSRNAATIPSSLADAELFGNARGYPNAGMPERPGLIGAAHESTLFLDEIGELSLPLQAHLLRVMDNGEYHRLGESMMRRANVRVVAATNRPTRDLKHDLLARFRLRVELPDLNARREDIPLLMRHILQRHAAQDVSLRERFFPDGNAKDSPRVAAALVESLVKHHYETNFRELETLLMSAVLKSRGRHVELENGIRTPGRRVGEGVPHAARVTQGLQVAAQESWLSDEETARLELLRRHRFSPTSCGRDPAYPGNRQTADLHFRHLACKALAKSGWDATQAARLLVGESDVVVLERCANRIETFVANLQLRVSCEPPDQLDRALLEDWKGLAGAVLPLVSVLRAERPPNAQPEAMRSS